MSSICYVDGTEDRNSDSAAETLLRAFRAKGYASSVDAQNAFLTMFPDPFTSSAGNPMLLSRIGVKHIDADFWDVTGEWSTRKLEFGTRKLRGQITATSINIKNAPVVASGGPGGSPAPQLYGAMNVTQGSDGLEVVGVDINVPGFAFSVTETLAPGTISLDWVNGLMAYANTANSGSWNGFAAGEVQFMGVEFSNDGNEGSEQATYNFEASRTVTSISIGGGLMVVPIKYGWDYLWILTEPAIDATAKSLVTRPRAWYTHRVVPWVNWAGLLP